MGNWTETPGTWLENYITQIFVGYNRAQIWTFFRKISTLAMDQHPHGSNQTQFFKLMLLKDDSKPNSRFN